MNSRIGAGFLDAVHSLDPVEGLTHGFYRYPARFSPLFARAAIEAFSKPSDVVLDPFMGGGTTLVEALAAGRSAIGTDTSSLAVFISTVKTTPLSHADLSVANAWGHELVHYLNVREPSERPAEWIRLGYQRNISGKSTWPTRKILEIALARVVDLPKRQQQDFARCVLLKTAQWALDCRTNIPSADEFRQRFLLNLSEMIAGASAFSKAVRKANCLNKSRRSSAAFCLHRSTIGIEDDEKLRAATPPRLILTSPPYPGVHVLYHRWQVQGRRETPAPFWIADRLDGNGAAFYTFGDRRQQDLSNYFDQIRASFESLARICDNHTTVVQMVSFSDPSWQLPSYLSVIQQSGFSEIKHPASSNSVDGRIWRSVPNRKWYANQRESIETNKEVVLFHRLA